MEKLIQSRKKRGWTQQDLADKAGFSRNSIVNWETGKREPKFIDIKTLANVLEISPNELLDAPSKIEDNVTQSFKSQQAKKISPYPSMSYWGEVIDNIHKVLEYGDIYEIAMIEPLLKSGYELLSRGKQKVIQTQLIEKKDTAVEQHFDVHDNQMEADKINIGTILSDKNGEGS